MEPEEGVLGSRSEVQGEQLGPQLASEGQSQGLACGSALHPGGG